MIPSSMSVRRKRGRLAIWTESDGYGCRATGCVHVFRRWTRLVVWMLAAYRGIDFVGEDVVFECLGDGLIEADEQMGQGLALAAHEHSQGVVLVGGHGDAAEGTSVRA